MKTYLTLVILLISKMAGAQDTLTLTLRQADSLFLQRNLLALAGRFQIEAAQAQVIQAGLFDNPTVTFEVSAYNSEAKRVLDVGGQGQKFLSIQQLIYTAGKRNKRVALAQEASRLTEFEFRDLLRGLRFELHSRFYDVYFQSNTVRRYDQQIATLQTTVSAFEREYERNNVSLRELLRLRSLLFQLSNDRVEIRRQLADERQILRTLLSTNQPLRPLANEAELDRYRLPTLSVDSLRDIALRNRSDVRVAESLTKQAELNYNLQKALAKPDLRVGGSYDQAASYIPNYVGLSVAADLPVFNRNQGAIRAARSQISYQQQLERQKTLQITNEIIATLQKVRDVEQLYQSVGGRFTEEFEQLNRGLIDNFQKRNISLLEFIDLFETYNENVRELNRLKADRVGAYEEFDYVTGTSLFN
ncbi:TolC family protein [Spirosoma jeollabukense]